MRRAILFLIFALFLAMVIQPNLNKQIKEKSKIDVPEQTNSTIITNDTVDNSRCKSKAVICIDASHGGSDAGYTSDGHTDQITCGESGLALNYEIRDMEEYVTNLSGEQNLEYIQDVRDVLTQVQKVWGKYE